MTQCHPWYLISYLDTSRYMCFARLQFTPCPACPSWVAPSVGSCVLRFGSGASAKASILGRRQSDSKRWLCSFWLQVLRGSHLGNRITGRGQHPGTTPWTTATSLHWQPLDPTGSSPSPAPSGKSARISLSLANFEVHAVGSSQAQLRVPVTTTLKSIWHCLEKSTLSILLLFWEGLLVKFMGPGS